MKKQIIVVIYVLALGLTGTAVAVSNKDNSPPKKYFVCKYVGTPGVDERLQTGQNPISVSENALTPPVVIGAYFNDQHGRSVAVEEDTGQPEPSCTVPENPVDLCENIEGVQVTVPLGLVKNDELCLVPTTDETPRVTETPSGPSIRGNKNQQPAK